MADCMCHNALLGTCIPESHTHHIKKKKTVRLRYKVTPRHVKSPDRKSACEKNHTVSLYGGVHVTVFRSTRRFSSLRPNYSINHLMTAHLTERGGGMNTQPLLLTHSATDPTNDVTDPCQPSDRSGDRKETFLSLCACVCAKKKIRIPCRHGENSENALSMQLD